MQKSDIDFKKIPDTPGVYLFKQGAEILYIGKATSLRDRVRSYFGPDLAEMRSPLVTKAILDADSLVWEETDSVLEALILEAKRIKQYWPKGNTDEKDDKSFAYLVVTKEAFPRFLIYRERELSVKVPRASLLALYGPFLSVASLREALKIMRRVFPFFDTPFPIDGRLSSSQEKMIIFNQTIGLYPKEFNKKEYAKTVRNLKLLFEAKKPALLKTLEREMKVAAKAERFEEANILKRQLFVLKHIQDLTLIKDELKYSSSASGLHGFRVEAYDTAHLRGDAARGVMTVVIDGEKIPSEYRTFTIRTAAAGDDFGALEEVIRRRAKHHEWPYPQVVVIDGGRAHLNRAKKILVENGMGEAIVVSVVKDERHRPREVFGPSPLVHTHEAEILLANAEAHRSAIGRHRRALRRAPYSI
ncbi:hypothetical protein A2841_01250 [Candidatus Kaiserbacteria bacterium RIFCSPHIGHO2_01_FULL_48_10]|uniref:Excinuclease ABC subunit C n=1 Tax=Candidatus Kaiserbacteria bacterium RIFCSPHIGHO2_01_FULL_48_10 TaxID=1798476 RepID=A0A1F6C2A1_9BACT|nr:MAG: hypothetical protein A2841_01250 [Candidatus Kaiserbacteria bacterium RIFCSPHIGHO2_01_FULL_48_10]